jgi:(E)-4-hydroxy-3-methylbut-2-enyl-diphosphate synthase
MKTNIKLINIGPIKIGGNSPITVQTMTNTPTQDVEATLAQIVRCADLGCDLIRVSVPTQVAADALGEICSKSPIPIIADIHFDHRLAISSIENGVAAIRINPGNIAANSSQGDQKLKAIADCANHYKVPIRVGVNSGSLEKALLDRYGKHSIHALVQSAFNQCQRLEQFGFSNIKVSIKSSTVLETIEANKLFRLESIDKYQKTGNLPYPLHIGITETGLPSDGIIKSAVGIGSLLTQHIGETIRVSLTASPEEEVKVGIKILEACGLRVAPVEIISCPGCARASNFSLEATAATVKQLTEKMTFKKPLKIAIMGCMVNGPGEAKDADFGISGLDQTISIFSHGKIIKTVPRDQVIIEIKKLLKAYTN